MCQIYYYFYYNFYNTYRFNLLHITFFGCLDLQVWDSPRLKICYLSFRLALFKWKAQLEEKTVKVELGDSQPRFSILKQKFNFLFGPKICIFQLPPNYLNCKNGPNVLNNLRQKKLFLSPIIVSNWKTIALSIVLTIVPHMNEMNRSDQRNRMTERRNLLTNNLPQGGWALWTLWPSQSPSANWPDTALW